MRQLFLQWSKKLFNQMGYDIHKKSTRRTMAQVLAHVTSLGFQPKTVLDVGVATGTFPLYQAFPQAYHFLVEPLEEFEEALQRICSLYQGSYVLTGVGKTEDRMILNVHADPSASSIYQEADGKKVDGIPREIPITTIDRLCEKHQLAGPFALKIDVQGAEIAVLEGASKTLEQTELVLLEVSFFEFYETAPQFYDVIAYMKTCGFVAYDFFGGHNRPFDGALAQIDVVFVKEAGAFRNNHFYATANQREQLSK